MKTKILMLMIAVIAVTLNGCKKDDDSGYQPKGTYGNASTTNSNTTTLNNWASLYDNGTDYTYESTINWSAITSTVASSGIVMVYLFQSPDWIALPVTDAGTGYSTSYSFYFHTGQVMIDVSGFDNAGSPTTSALNGTQVRIVTVSPAQRIANPNVNYKNYNEVVKAFDLKN